MNHNERCEKLLENAKFALIAAIEIYNKPIFQYREECVSVLLLNAWELVLKALLSKHKKSIFSGRKVDGKEHSLSWSDALTRAKSLFPKSIPFELIKENLFHLAEYRNNTIHFYNESEFKTEIYLLAQATVKNLVDLMWESFKLNLSDDINWQILPIGITPPVDAASYISRRNDRKRSAPVQQFLSKLQKSVESAERDGTDTARIVVGVQVNLMSTKKTMTADTVVGVTDDPDMIVETVIEKNVNPNTRYPHRQKEIVENLSTFHGEKFTSHTFQAIAWKYGAKKDERYCWIAEKGPLTLYSSEFVSLLKNLSATEIADCLLAYKQHRKDERIARTSTQ